MLEYFVLGMVFDEDLTGYDIKKYIENGIGVFYKASFGSIYPTLRKLTAKNCLTMYDKPQGNRPKKLYQITTEGRAVFQEWLISPMNVLDGVNSHLAKVYFFDKLPADSRNAQLTLYEQNSIQYLQKLLAMEKDFRKMEDNHCYYYKLSTLYYGICATQETIRWCQHIRTGQPLTELIHKEELSWNL